MEEKVKTGFTIALFLFLWTLGLIWLQVQHCPTQQLQEIEQWSKEEKAAVVEAMQYHGVGNVFGQEVNGSITYFFKRKGETCKLLTWDRRKNCEKGR
jgi:hypothetical protein